MTVSQIPPPPTLGKSSEVLYQEITQLILFLGRICGLDNYWAHFLLYWTVPPVSYPPAHSCHVNPKVCESKACLPPGLRVTMKQALHPDPLSSTVLLSEGPFTLPLLSFSQFPNRAFHS